MPKIGDSLPLKYETETCLFYNNNNNICIAPLGRNFRDAGGGRSVVCANRVLN